MYHEPLQTFVATCKAKGLASRLPEYRLECAGKRTDHGLETKLLRIIAAGNREGRKAKPYATDEVTKLPVAAILLSLPPALLL